MTEIVNTHTNGRGLQTEEVLCRQVHGSTREKNKRARMGGQGGVGMPSVRECSTQRKHGVHIV